MDATTVAIDFIKDVFLVAPASDPKIWKSVQRKREDRGTNTAVKLDASGRSRCQGRHVKPTRDYVYSSVRP